MVLRLKIKNFGKVRSADILLSNMVLFVGNNNSGKTMVMQLIYGMRKELSDFPVTDSGTKRSESNGKYLVLCAQDWFREVELQINEYLAENKSLIVERIFGSPILIEEIKIALEDTKSEYFVSSISEYPSRELGERETRLSINTTRYENGEKIESIENSIPKNEYSQDALKETLKSVWNTILSGGSDLDARQLFLPASRSGLQLLYKYYFAGETKENLVMPMKDFLRFIQLYSADKQLDEARKALLTFGEENLLEGSLMQKGDEMFYIDRHGERAVSLYIASSMIHELASFIMALNATQKIDWLYCDEVENSLHPLMQREMARWLIRMVNAGMHVIVSSHSDTMASRLNNLFLLTQMNRRKADYERLAELKLLKADLLNPDMDVSVYEFRSGEQGKTTVEKLEFIDYPPMGYDFRLFSQNLDKLYDEANKITR